MYQGPPAFILCLYALVEFREWSFRLSHPALLPFARKALDLLSDRRATLSRWLRESPDDELARRLQECPPPECGNRTIECLAAVKHNASH